MRQPSSSRLQQQPDALDFSVFVNNQHRDSRTKRETNTEEYPDESVQLINDFITDRHGIRKKALLGELQVIKRRSASRKRVIPDHINLQDSRLRSTLSGTKILSNSLSMHAMELESSNQSQLLDSLPVISAQKTKIQTNSSNNKAINGVMEAFLNSIRSKNNSKYQLRSQQQQLQQEQIQKQAISEVQNKQQIPANTDRNHKQQLQFIKSEPKKLPETTREKKTFTHYLPRKTTGHSFFKGFGSNLTAADNSNSNNNNLYIQSESSPALDVSSIHQHTLSDFHSISLHRNTQTDFPLTSTHKSTSISAFNSVQIPENNESLKETKKKQTGIVIINQNDSMNNNNLSHLSRQTKSQYSKNSLVNFLNNAASNSTAPQQSTSNYLIQQETSTKDAKESLLTQTAVLFTSRSGYRLPNTTIRTKTPITLVTKSELKSTQKTFIVKPSPFEEKGRFLQIKIKNIANFKDEPLIKYDIHTLQEDAIVLALSKGVILSGHSKYINDEGQSEWKHCQILKYDVSTGLFRIQWSSDRLRTKDVTRLNLIIENENLEEFQDRANNAATRRHDQLYLNSLNHQIDDDSNFSDILIWKEQFYSILNKSLAPFKDPVRELYRDAVTQLIIDQYKHGVLLFILCLQTVDSMEAYYHKYLLSLANSNRPLMVDLKVIEEFSANKEQPIGLHITIPSPKKKGVKIKTNNDSVFIDYSNENSALIHHNLNIKYNTNIDDLDSSPSNTNNDSFENETLTPILRKTILLKPSNLRRRYMRDHNQDEIIGDQEQPDIILSHREIAYENYFTKMQENLSRSLCNSSCVHMLDCTSNTVQTTTLAFEKIIKVSTFNLFEYILDHNHLEEYPKLLGGQIQTTEQDNTIQKLNYSQILSEKFNRIVGNMEMEIYGVEKTVDDCVGVLLAKSRLVEQVVKTSRELPDFNSLVDTYKRSSVKQFNLALRASLRLSLVNSFSKTIGYLNGYFAILPLQKLTPLLYQVLPYSLMEKRNKSLLDQDLLHPNCQDENNRRHWNQTKQIEELSDKEQLNKQRLSSEETTNPFWFDMKMIFVVYKSLTFKILQNDKEEYLQHKQVVQPPLVRLNLTLQQKARKNPVIKDIVIYILRNRNKVFSLKKSLGSRSVQRLKPMDGRYEKEFLNRGRADSSMLSFSSSSSSLSSASSMNSKYNNGIEGNTSDNHKHNGSHTNPNNDNFPPTQGQDFIKEEQQQQTQQDSSDCSFFSTPLLHSVDYQNKRSTYSKKIKKQNKLKGPLKDAENYKKGDYSDQSPSFTADMNFIMYDVLRLNQSECKNFESFLEKSKNKEVTYKRLGWLFVEGMRIQYDSRLEDIEEQLQLGFQSPIEKLIKMEQIFGYMDHSTFTDLEEEVHGLHQAFNTEYNMFLRWSLYPVYALLIMINQFDFYLFDFDYTQELVFIFTHSNQVKFIGQERQNILNDREFILTKMPDEMQLGMFLVDTREIKATLIKRIDQCVTNINLALTNKLNTLLTEKHDQMESFMQTLSLFPTTIEEHINLMEIINDKKLKAGLRRFEDEMIFSEQIFEVMVQNYVPYEDHTLHLFLESKLWVFLLSEAHTKAQKRFEGGRNKFKLEFEHRQRQVIASFKSLLETQKKIVHSPQLKQYEENLRNCRNIEETYKFILTKGRTLNNQQSLLGYQTTDFSEIERACNGFSRYVQFWEFTEKWFRLSENWDQMTFMEIFKSEMTQEIKIQIVTTCREGKSLLDKLKLLLLDDNNIQGSQKVEELEKKQIKDDNISIKKEGSIDDDDDENKTKEREKEFLQLIDQVDKSIEKFCEYVPLSVVLIDKAFIGEYQDKLMREFMPGERFENLSMSRLRKENVKKRSDQIYGLQYRASCDFELKEIMTKAEQTVEKDIVVQIAINQQSQNQGMQQGKQQNSTNDTPLSTAQSIQITQNQGIPSHSLINTRQLLKRMHEIEVSCNIVLSSALQMENGSSNIEQNNNKMEQHLLFAAYLQTLIQAFECLVEAQEHMFKLSSFFANPFHYLSNDGKVLLRFNSFRDQFKQHILNAKTFFVRTTPDIAQELQNAKIKLAAMQDLCTEAEGLRDFVRTFLMSLRGSCSKLYMLTDYQLIDLLFSTHNNELLSQVKEGGQER